jgi:hypothetical protein
MPIAPINLFARTAATNAADQLAATATTATTAPTANAVNTAAVTGTNLTTFTATLGQLLATLGPLALDTTLTTVGAGNNTGAAPTTGFANTLVDLLLLNSLGQGQFPSSPVTQQLLLSQLLFSTAGTGDALGLGLVAEDQLAAALVRQGADGSLFVQLNNVSTLPNPIVFSSGALAQAFQIGNGTGSPP